jgi:hypothetical protein
MICCSQPGLTEALYGLYIYEFSLHCKLYISYFWQQTYKDNDKWQTRPLVRRGALLRQARNCHTVSNIWSWAPDGARHQDKLTDWSSVIMGLWLWRHSTDWHPTRRSKEDIPQDKESQRAAYSQHGPDQLRSATQLSLVYASSAPVYVSSAPARLSWLQPHQPASFPAVFISPRSGPFQGQ